MRLFLIGAVLAAAGCLSPGSSPLSPLDQTPPLLVRLKPDLTSDGGTPLTLPVATTIEVTFSEELDPGSLRPGISVFWHAAQGDPYQEVQLNLVAPPAVKNTADLDREYTVSVSAAGARGFEVGTCYLLLKNLLIDRQGNPIALEGEQPEAIYFFFVR